MGGRGNGRGMEIGAGAPLDVPAFLCGKKVRDVVDFLFPFILQKLKGERQKIASGSPRRDGFYREL